MNPHAKQNLKKLADRTPEREAMLLDIERKAFANFHGQTGELLSALGMLRLGDHFGWRPLVIMHSKRTIRKYEDILGISIREFFPEEGPSASRSRGFKVAKTFSNFWKAVSGDEKIEGRQEIE
ncbi:MAG: hypothetical protein R3E86_11540 [Pseudomonadales bacterium]